MRAQDQGDELRPGVRPVGVRAVAQLRIPAEEARGSWTSTSSASAASATTCATSSTRPARWLHRDHPWAGALLPDLTSDNRQRREMAERMALNAPIQGSAADIIKVAMLRVAAALSRRGGERRGCCCRSTTSSCSRSLRGSGTPSRSSSAGRWGRPTSCGLRSMCPSASAALARSRPLTPQSAARPATASSGFSQTKIAVPGMIRPRSGSTAPSRLVPVRPLRLHEVQQPKAGGHDLPDPVAERRWCSTYVARPVVVFLDVRAAIPVRTSPHRSRRARVVREAPADRMGDREDPSPAGRSTGQPRASPPAESATNGTAPKAEQAGRSTRPRTAAAPRRPARRGRHGRRRDSSRAYRAGLAETSIPTDQAPCRSNHREHCAAPQPTSSTRRPATSPSKPASASSRPSGHQTKPSSRRNSPCSAWYLSARRPTSGGWRAAVSSLPRDGGLTAGRPSASVSRGRAGIASLDPVVHDHRILAAALWACVTSDRAGSRSSCRSGGLRIRTSFLGTTNTALCAPRRPPPFRPEHPTT